MYRHVARCIVLLCMLMLFFKYFFLNILEQEYDLQKQIKGKLVKFKYQNKLVFIAQYALAPVNLIVEEEGFIHLNSVTSYKL